MTRSDGRRRLLVVDDDEGMTATLRDILGASGYGVDVAHSGLEAVEHLRAHQPQGILMDIRMPGMNGLETFRAAKTLAPASFVILMTAFSDRSLVGDARREGAVDVLAKPLDVDVLLRLIARTAGPSPAPPEAGAR